MNSINNSARDESYFRSTGTLFNAAKDWSSIVENFPYGSAALILYVLLYQSELVPRWLSV
jgi:hypothetical protein